MSSTSDAAPAEDAPVGRVNPIDHVDRNAQVYGAVAPAHVIDLPDASTPEDDGGRARRRAMLAELRAANADQDQRLAHPVLRGSAAFRGLSRTQVQALGDPRDREISLALWEEANEAHLAEDDEPAEGDAAAAESAPAEAAAGTGG